MILLAVLAFFLLFLNILPVPASPPRSLWLIISAIISACAISIFSFVTESIGLARLLNYGLLSLVLIGLTVIQRKRIKHFFSKTQLFSFLKEQQLLLYISSVGLLLFGRYVRPWGGWDGWAIWNMKAKFIATDHFKEYLQDSQLKWSHLDYPPMLPQLSSFFIGTDSNMIISPAIIQVFILLGIFSLLWFSIRKKKNILPAALAISILAFDRHFISQVSSQYADSLIALFILAATIYLIKFSKKNIDFAILGILVASSLWIKNEGIVITSAFSLYLIIFHRRPAKQILYFALGALPFILTLIYFKSQVSIDNDIFRYSSDHIVESLSDFSRFNALGLTFLKTLVIQYPLLLIGLVVYLVLHLRKKRIYSPEKNSSRYLLLIPATILTVYLCFYLITPYDQQWHMDHSIYRLIHHIYPTLILLITLKVVEYNDAFQLRKIGK